MSERIAAARGASGGTVSNPVFSSSPIFGERRRGAAGTAPQAGPYGTPYGPAYGTAGTAGTVAADAGALEQMYSAPAATTRDTGRLTYDDVIVKTGGLLLLLVVVAAASWTFAPRMPGLWLLGALVGLLLDHGGRQQAVL